MGGAREGKRSNGDDVNTALVLQTLKTLKIKFKNSLPRTLPFPHFNDSNRNFKVRACKSVVHTFFFKWGRERPVEVSILLQTATPETPPKFARWRPPWGKLSPRGPPDSLACFFINLPFRLSSERRQ